MNRGIFGIFRRKPSVEQALVNRLADQPLLASFISPLSPTTESWYISGQIAAQQPGTMTPTLNRLYFWPHFTARDVFIDNLAFNVTTQGASANVVNLGIYDNLSPRVPYPGRLRFQSGDMDTVASTGAKKAPCPMWLYGQRLYWFAFLMGTGTAAVVRANAATGMANIFGIPSGISAVTQSYAWKDLGAYGPLPQVFPSAPTFPSSGNPPLIGFRVMSN